MIFDRFSLIARLSPERRAVQAMAERWVQVDQRNPDLAEDIIRIGGVLAQAPQRFVEGEPMPDPVDPILLAKREGRREMALELLALMKLSPAELAVLMEDTHDDF